MEANIYDHFGRHDLRDFDGEEEITSPNVSVGEPASIEWTDEKHSSYLNSMEASFVNQLYGYSPSAYKSHHSSSHVSSGLFKVFRNNCWEMHRVQRSNLQLSFGASKSVKQVYMGSPWVRHFRSVHKSHDTKSPHGKEKAALGVKSVVPSRKKPLHSHTHFVHESALTCDEEVSDQNFVSEDP